MVRTFQHVPGRQRKVLSAGGEAPNDLLAADPNWLGTARRKTHLFSDALAVSSRAGPDVFGGLRFALGSDSRIGGIEWNHASQSDHGRRTAAVRSCRHWARSVS